MAYPNRDPVDLRNRSRIHCVGLAGVTSLVGQTRSHGRSTRSHLRRQRPFRGRPLRDLRDGVDPPGSRT